MSRVTVTNPFDLLADEGEDRTNAPAPKKEQKPTSAPAKPAAKPAAAGAAAAKPAAPAATTPATHNANQVVKPAPPRDANQNLQEREKESRAPRDKRDGPRQPKPAGADTGKRAFDRKSGTGRPQNEEKKSGAGKGNWGEVEAKEGAEALKDEKTDEKEEGEEEKVTVVEGEKKDEPAKEGAAPAAEEKKEDLPTRTLEEYLADKKKSNVKVEALKPRTVNDDDFKGLVALERGEAGIPPLNAKDKKEKKPKEGTAKPAASAEGGEKKDKKDKQEKNLASKLLTFSSHQDQKRAERGNNYRERSGYGGEERRNSGGDNRPPQGGRGRGGAPKGTYSSRPGPTSPGGSQPPVDQEKDFPSLSPHGSDPVKA